MVRKAKEEFTAKDRLLPGLVSTVSFCTEAEAAKVIISYNNDPVQVCCPLVGSTLEKALCLLIKQDFRVFEIGAIS